MYVYNYVVIFLTLYFDVSWVFSRETKTSKIDEISLAIFRFFDKNSRSIYTIHSDFINGISDLTHPISQ